MFNEFLRDRVTIKLPDGTVIAENVPAQVGKKISVHNVSIPLQPGYIIARSLPSGITEEYLVEDPGYIAAFHSIPAHYAARVRHKDAPQRGAGTVNYNLSGPNARVNIGSYDTSQNILYHAGSPDELFAAIREAIRTGIEQGDTRDLMLQAVAGLAESANTPTFVERYKDFINTFALHITILTPFIPALTQLIPHAH